MVLLPRLVAAVALLVLAAPEASAAVPVLVIDGEGFGHGVGMAQDGAYWMGRGGAPVGGILGHFYPGVPLGRGAGGVRVAVLDDADAATTLTFPDGGDVRSPRSGPQSAGFPINVPRGGAVHVRHDGTYRVTPAGAIRARSVGAELLPTPQTTTTTPGKAPPPSTAPSPSPTTAPDSPDSAERTSGSSVWAAPANGGTIGVPDRDARYRGEIEAVAGGAGLRLLNEVDVEQYLRGMGEVRDPSWPPASLQAQAIVARTYALRAMAANGEICDTQRCQVYLGQQAEYGAMDRAVTATAGQVLLHRGRYAAAVYSAHGAGVSATPAEGFGTPDGAYPYLRAIPYESRARREWEVRMAVSDAANRLRYPGTLETIEVASTGPSGRPLQVTLDGTAGRRTVPALEFADALSLRSTKWRTRVDLAEVAPPPPTDEGLQTFPDHAAATWQQPTQQPSRATPPTEGSADSTNATALLLLLAATGAASGLARRARQPHRDV